MKPLNLVLLVLLALLQYRLFVADGNLMQLHRLAQEIQVFQGRVESMEAHNRSLLATVENLRRDTGAIEQRARYDLGMIRKDEILYQVVR